MVPAKKTPKRKTTRTSPQHKGEKKLRIAQMHWGFPPIIGGVETHLAIMMPTFVRMGHKVDLLTGSVEGTPTRYEFEGAGIRRSPLMDLNWLFKRGLAGIQEEIDDLFTSFIEETKPDLVHAHNMHYFSKPHAEALTEVAKKKGIPVVLTAHNVWDDVLFLRLTRDIDWTHIIAVSHYIRMELHGIGIDDQRTTTIHHGINISRFSRERRSRRVLSKYPQLKRRKVVFHLVEMQPQFLSAVNQFEFVLSAEAVDNKLVIGLDDPEMHNPMIVDSLVQVDAKIQFVGEVRQRLEDVYLELVKA